MSVNKTNIFNKIVVALCAFSLVLTSAIVFSACGTMYTSKAGTMEEMVGTYRLTTYIQKDNGEEVDRIEQLHVKAYVVVGSDGTGYYAYQDDNTEFWYDSILIQYTKEPDSEDLYKAIRFTNGKSNISISYQKPGNGLEPPMGFNSNNKTFNYFIPDDPGSRGINPSYYTSVIYTKISDATDLSTIESEMNKPNLAPLAKFGIKNLNGALIFSAGMPNGSISPDTINPEYNKYKYYVVDFEAVNEKANIYYELIEGSAGAQVENNVPIEVNVVKTTDEYSTYTYVAVKFFNQYYTAPVTFGAPTNYLNYSVDTEPDEYGSRYQIYNNSFSKYWGDKTTIADIVADQLALYNEQHPLE